MPSPFPGMDPYLEGSLWTSVHTALAVQLVHILNPLLLPRYFAFASRRMVLGIPQEPDIAIGDVYPDVSLRARPNDESESTPVAGGTAIAAPVRMVSLVPSRIPHITVEIRDVENRQLVTAIEILSPTNKRKGRGFNDYQRRREQLLLGAVHLMEIDWLHQGRRILLQGPLPAVPYFVFLTRSWDFPITETWPIALEQPLPVVPVPLREGEQSIAIDLGQALTRVYDDCCFRQIIDYAKPPEVRLAAEETVWVDAHLRAAGLRS